jgi:hypothetical protein
MQHKDRDGKIISTLPVMSSARLVETGTDLLLADPDLSNPTRSRLERPLDTIRGFEAAIENHRKQNRM